MIWEKIYKVFLTGKTINAMNFLADSVQLRDLSLGQQGFRHGLQGFVWCGENANSSTLHFL